MLPLPQELRKSIFPSTPFKTPDRANEFMRIVSYFDHFMFKKILVSVSSKNVNLTLLVQGNNLGTTTFNTAVFFILLTLGFIFRPL